MNGKDVKEHYGRRLSVEEFLIDFLGGLVPGILFVTGICFALIPTANCVMRALAYNQTRTFPAEIFEIVSKTQNTPSAIWIGIFVWGLLLSYVIGHLFYRLDPKKADRSSFCRLARFSENRTDELKEQNLGCASADDCEFPYPAYHRYLEQRGLSHLLPFVLWKSNESYRSKTYVNLLKLRLRHYFPDKCGVIIRNEAHVRLAASTWYVSAALFYFGFFCLLAIIMCLILTIRYHANTDWSGVVSSHVPSLIPPLLLLLFSAFAWWTIRKFLHYQRLREVFFVLETAYTAFYDDFKKLYPPFDAEALERTKQTRNASDVPASGGT